MNRKSKRKSFAEKIIVASWLIAIVSSLFVFYYSNFVASANSDKVPFWCVFFFLFASILMLFGVLLGTRGVGVPLTLDRFFSLSLGYPRWILAIIYTISLFLLKFSIG
jgi:hypothetical protein